MALKRLPRIVISLAVGDPDPIITRRSTDVSNRLTVNKSTVIVLDRALPPVELPPVELPPVELPHLAASPTNIVAGTAITATWSSIATPTAKDWIGLYVPGAAAVNHLAWVYVSGSKTADTPRASGSCSLIVPSTLAGTYELRLLANDGETNTLATSAPFTVIASSTTIPPAAPALASARNARTAQEYSNVQVAVEEAQDGDVIEVSPGDLFYGKNCGREAAFGGGTNTHIPIRVHLTLKAMDPAKRPVIRPEPGRRQDADGITLGAPWEVGNRKLNVVIDGLVFQNLGIEYSMASAIRIRNTYGSRAGNVTLRNIAADLCTGGIKGSADNLLLEDIRSVDGGDGTGSEHNFYVGGGVVTARRVHSIRNRISLDGHVFKCRSQKLIIEDSILDNRRGDASAVLQHCHGGELIMRRTTLIQGAGAANAKGMIWYGDEGQYGGVLRPGEDGHNAATWEAWLADWGQWLHSYDIQECSFLDYFGNGQLIHKSASTPPRVREIFLNNLTPAVVVPPRAPDTTQGALDGADCERIHGWAWDGVTDAPLTVDIYVDGLLTTSTVANINSPSLLAAGKGNGVHAFSVLTPASAKDGLKHYLRCLVGPAYELPNSPRSITCAPTSPVDPLPSPPPVEPPPPPPVQTDWPAWRQALTLNTITNISPPGRTAASAYKAAGYYLPGWEGDASTNLSAWAGGIHVPTLGKWGALLCGMNGHSLQPASTIHHFDFEKADWLTPIGPPAIHRQIAPNYLPPPADAECWYDPDNRGNLPLRDVATLWSTTVVTTPFHAQSSSYSFARWPLPFGCRYDTNVGSGMRYDNYAFIPASCGGESPLGTVAFIAPNISHEFNAGTGSSSHTWNFGVGSRKWLPHSLDKMQDHGDAACGVSCNTALSVKHKRVFTASEYFPNMGSYNPVSNSHARALVEYTYRATPVEGTAIVTEGHEAHLFICFGQTTSGSGERCLSVTDLDVLMTKPPAKGWAILNHNSPVPHGDGRVKPLTPAVAFNQYMSLAWSQQRQELMLFSVPGGSSPTIIHRIKIPTGQSNGVPNWQTKEWTVTAPQIAFGPNTTSVSKGVIGLGYKRFSWIDALDCGIWIGAPESGPVQALCL